MRHMAAVRRVIRPEVGCHRRQQPRSFSTDRLHPLAGETRPGWRPPRMPRVVIACWCCRLQHHGVAFGGHPHQAHPARPRVLQGHRPLCVRHRMRQTGACCLTVCHSRCFNVTGDLVLRSRGRADKPMAARALHNNRPTQRLPQAPRSPPPTWRAMTHRGKKARPGTRGQNAPPAGQASRRSGAARHAGSVLRDTASSWAAGRWETPWACRAPSCANRSARSLRAQRG
jgi:hypothetical protein